MGERVMFQVLSGVAIRCRAHAYFFFGLTMDVWSFAFNFSHEGGGQALEESMFARV